MKIKSLKELKNIKGQRILLRVDFNVPISSGGKIDKSEDYRIVQTLPTIKYLIKNKAKIIIMAHLGRPDGKVVEALRLDPVAVRLSHLLKKGIYKSQDILGQEVEKHISEMKDGDILMLENVRFDKREEKGDKKFAQELAKLGDIYINDAFAVCHRDQASVSTIADYLPSYAGFLLEDELNNLSAVINKPIKPLTVIIGGAKISTKIQLIKRFLTLADSVLLGGALANTVLNVMGVTTGKSLVEPKMYPIIKKIKLTDNKLRVPVDGVMAKNYEAKIGRLDALADVRPEELILDIGPDTIKLYEKIIKSSKMVVWNGPMGLIETPFFAKGTEDLVKILAKSKAYTVAGGGESVQVIRRLGLEKKFNFVSTGGGAMLEFLEGKKLPGLKKILIK
ncbi:MAG: phosphoglycerate kinase [Candidatus Buchananbacteria bacterium]|nr:phosphoglycerate kinase [Candidatus Buchananbacteria bacterium]